MPRRQQLSFRLPSVMKIVLAFTVGLFLFAGAAQAQIPSLGGASSTSGANVSASAEPSLDDLIKILENDASRKKLVESLKAAAYQAPGAAPGVAAPAEPAAVIRSLPGQIADYTRGAIGAVTDSIQDIPATWDAAVGMLAGARSINLPNIVEAILPVALVAVVVFIMLFGCRRLEARIFRRLAHGAEHASPLHKLLNLVLSAIVDVVAVTLSWASGFLAAAILLGGKPGINQALFLNAFLLIEMIKVALSAFVAPNFPQLRLTPFSNRQASYWYFWISRLVSILGYTFLFVAPIVQQSSSLAAADAVRMIVVLFSTALTIGLILKNRGTVRERLKRAKHRGDRSFRAQVNALIGQVWWILAIVFVLSLFGVWLRSPETGFTYMTTATLKSIAAMAVGGLVVSVLSRVIASGIPIPQGAKDRLPLLERRVNSFIPNALIVIRTLVVIVVVAVILEAWSLVSVSGWVARPIGQEFVGSLIGAGLILAIGAAIYIAVSSWIEYRLNPNFGKVPTARERTLLSLFRNAFTITMVVVIAMLVLSQIGIDIAPLLAGAGVVGLAIGFGAQKFVQDIITGAFIQIQNAMNEGDVVELNGVSGVVEQLTVRSVGIRSLDGTWYLIPFSSVEKVANFSKDFAYYVADVGVAYRENIDDVKQMMFDAFDELKASDVGENLISGFDMWGVNELGDSAVVVRGRVMTKPSTQWGVGRAYREIVKRMADERGIEIPFPHMTVWFGEDRGGKAPPIRLRSDSGRSAEKTIAGERAEVTDGRSDGGSRHGTYDDSGHPIPPSDNDLDSAGGGRG
ncbi:mechanosensitive ion channel domain-containing protein [Aurantimonas sp. VKM B-3413]|uniref:mechanosensitive ion channel domain-containing protein n=1 Tax=Aurantimonas sp. VKM B-3413 TaxID=2779401 RepID=UPI001E6064B8|nr:mechanosensitive ion channel domain-containing protein [Aurantimonas sp. VKM B-3413]MCB8840630.1 mechanosensitive ion channel [Aurantimonas sp. VKM B-3413]